MKKRLSTGGGIEVFQTSSNQKTSVCRRNWIVCKQGIIQDFEECFRRKSEIEVVTFLDFEFSDFISYEVPSSSRRNIRFSFFKKANFCNIALMILQTNESEKVTYDDGTIGTNLKKISLTFVLTKLFYTLLDSFLVLNLFRYYRIVDSNYRKNYNTGQTSFNCICFLGTF